MNLYRTLAGFSVGHRWHYAPVGKRLILAMRGVLRDGYIATRADLAPILQHDARLRRAFPELAEWRGQGAEGEEPEL